MFRWKSPRDLCGVTGAFQVIGGGGGLCLPRPKEHQTGLLRAYPTYLVLALIAASRRASNWASPEKFLAPRVRDSPGRNSPLFDATTLVRGAYRQRSVRRHFSRPLLTQLQRNRCWQLMPCGQFYEATAPRLAILNAASPVETNSPPGYMAKPAVPACTRS
ncbi:MAG: hypothetical protein K0R39_1343 [Symbiobacteriaceae bacterium]|nr:hypothetical protein [Symbiobacteriaceae bacterium]